MTCTWPSITAIIVQVTKFVCYEIIGIMPQGNSHMVDTNNKEQVVVLVVTRQQDIVVHHLNHQALHMVKVLHNNKEVILKQDIVNLKHTLVHNQQTLTNNHPVVDSMVVNQITNRVVTKVTVTVAATPLPVQLKVMAVNLVDMVNRVVILVGMVNPVVRSLEMTINSMVDVLIKETEVMVMIEGMVGIVGETVVVVVVTIVVVMIAMVTVVVVVMVVVATVVMTKEAMEGMYY